MLVIPSMVKCIDDDFTFTSDVIEILSGASQQND